MHCSKILEKDCSLFLERYENKLNIIMTKTVSSGHEAILSYDADQLDISSEEIKKIYNKVCAAVREDFIVSYTNNLCNSSTSNRKTFEYSYELRNYYENNESKKILQKHIDKLYNIKCFPITDMSDDKYYTCYNVMSILYRVDRNKFLKYCDEIECDRMAKYRMSKLMEEISRNF